MNIEKYRKKKRQAKKKWTSKRKLLCAIICAIPLVFFITVVGYKDIAKGKGQTESGLTAEKTPYPGGTKNISGNYGSLEIDPVILQPQEDYFDKQTDFDKLVANIKSDAQWTFTELSREQVQSLYVQAGLSPDICQQLMENTKPNPAGKGFVTTPPDSLLWSFSPEERANLYPLIGQYPGNPSYTEPYHFSLGNPDKWVYNSSLPASVASKLQKLIYVNHGLNLISDLHLLIPYLKTKTDWNRLLQTVFRSTSMEVYLNIRQGEDIEPLAQYWGNLGREADIKPLLKKLSNQAGGGKINLSQLLPAIAKERVYTYTSKNETKKYPRDCKWTAFNFFNSQSDDRYYNIDEIQQSYFDAISKPANDESHLKFGDILYLRGSDEKIVHTCVYIADGLVYTKNGINSDKTISPFMLSNYNEILTLYMVGRDAVSTTYYSRVVADTHQIKDIK